MFVCIFLELFFLNNCLLNLFLLVCSFIDPELKATFVVLVFLVFELFDVKLFIEFDKQSFSSHDELFSVLSDLKGLFFKFKRSLFC